jgi:hypothetical protein
MALAEVVVDQGLHPRPPISRGAPLRRPSRASDRAGDDLLTERPPLPPGCACPGLPDRRDPETLEKEAEVGTHEERRTAAEEPARVADDPASTVLTGFPGARIGHTETGGQTLEDVAAGVLTGYPGDRTADHVRAGTHGLDDPAAGVLAGYPGPRATHSESGGQDADDLAAGVLTGYPGDRSIESGPPRATATSRTVDATEDRP